MSCWIKQGCLDEKLISLYIVTLTYHAITKDNSLLIQCCHNRGMIVGDWHGLWKTEGGHSQGVLTAKQLYLVLSENEAPEA